MKINLYKEGNFSAPFNDISIKKIKSIVNRICKIINIENAELTIIFCDNSLIKKINRKYRGKNSPTDVIAFSYREFPFPAIDIKTESIGDIYISLEKASENAISFGTMLTEEIKRLIVHGILHLAGFDHEKSEAEDRIMRNKEDEILEIL
jgi:probable rRNA maturation factor